MKHTLKERAMLVTLSVSYWTGRAADERVIDEVTKKHGTDRDAHEYRKILVAPAAVKAFHAVRNAARQYHFEKTLPWIDGGTRILPSGFYFDYTEKMREFRSEYETEIQRFLGNYTKLKGEARKRLGTLFREEDYPKTDELRAKFEWKQAVLPIPDKDDWRVSLGEKADAEIRKQIDDQVKVAMQIATKDLWTRLYDVVEKLAEKLKDAEGVFRDSLLGNITELVDLLPKMNVGGDPQLDKMTARVKKELAGFKLTDLREDKKVRKNAGDAADKILKAMAGYIGTK